MRCKKTNSNINDYFKLNIQNKFSDDEFFYYKQNKTKLKTYNNINKLFFSKSSNIKEEQNITQSMQNEIT